MQADAAIRGAASMFFGNEVAAAMDASLRSDARRWGERYHDNHAAENARDAYDAVHRPVAQTVGQLGGIAMAMMLSRGAAAPVVRLPGAAKLSGREVTAILGAGGLTGLGSQLPLGGARAAGAGGATTSAAQDLFNGRTVSLERLGRAYNLAALMGRLGEDGGRATSDRLPPVQKGRLGEVIGSARSTANTWMREPGKKVERYGAPGTYRPRTILDGRSGVYRFEDKFGYDPTMSDGQLAAQAALGDYFKLYHSVPEDVGLATSLPAAVAGSQVVLERPRPRTLDEVTYEQAVSRMRSLPQATAVQPRR